MQKSQFLALVCLECGEKYFLGDLINDHFKKEDLIVKFKLILHMLVTCWKCN